MTAVNDAPVATADTVTTLEDADLTFGVTGNDSDVDGDLMTVTGFSVGGTGYAAESIATIAGQGTLILNENGTFIFTP